MPLKNKVLEILEKNRDSAVSGQELADGLGVSRTAIWKAINSLKESGHAIEAVTNKGYRLLKNSDVLSAEGIRPYLKDMYRGYAIEVFEELDSTSTYAKKLALDGGGHGTVILAERQYAGRGRLGRSFYSPEGRGLYMSVILRPEGSIAASMRITVAAAVAVCRAVAELTGRSASIKWVNDIFLDGKKICGILTEGVSDFESGMIESLVVGIGINVKGMDGQLPEELRQVVGSLFAEELSRNQLAAAVLNELYDLAQNLSDAALMKEYKEHSLVLGKRIFYKKDGRQYSGTAIDINEEGNLVVSTEEGTEVLRSGEVSLGSEQFL